MSKKTRLYIVLTALLFLYIYLGYFLERENFYILFFSWITSFLVTYFYILPNYTEKQLFYIGVFIRLLLLFATPRLSQDFYRFLWDGNMSLSGYNPYLSYPLEWQQQGNFPICNAQELITGMRNLNASHYTNYPPVSQFIYWLVVVLSFCSISLGVFGLHLVIFLAEILTYVFGRKILENLKFSLKRVHLYFLNPFVILELNANLHLEGIMVCLLVLSLYFLQRQKHLTSAIALGLSVATKLIPLLFLPLYLRYFINFKSSASTINIKDILKILLFYITVVVVVILSFLPFISYEFVDNFTQSIRLWFDKFEFNASIYYVVRWFGYQIVGWNIIATSGKILALISTISILFLSLLKSHYKSLSKLTEKMLFVICIYYSLSTTIHPWYLAIPLVLSVFTHYHFLFVWSILIVLSYSAYTINGFHESMLWVAVQYILVYVCFVYEVYFKSRYPIKFLNEYF